MQAIRIISLIARIALMITMILGLLFWVALLFGWSSLLTFLTQVNFTSIHEGFGTIGVLGLLILGGIVVFARGSRLLGAGGMIYALLVPTFGMTQTLILVGDLHWLIRAAHLLVGIGAMYLARRIEKRSGHLRQMSSQTANSGMPASQEAR